MANEVDGLIDNQIDAKLKKIMEQRNIHNYAVMKQNDETEDDAYIKAAKSINEFIMSCGYKFDISDEEMGNYYNEFIQKFSPETLTALSDDDLLKYIFFSADSTNDSLCYYLEFHQQIRKGCGSVAGGSAYKYGLFQRKEDSVWISGSPANPKELTDTDALAIGREMRDLLVKGANIISKASLNTIAEYEKLDDDLNSEKSR